MNQIEEEKVLFQFESKGQLYTLGDRLVFQLSKDWIKILQWIDKGTSKDPARAKLQVIHATEKYIESTNGFVIHRVVFKYGKQIIPAGIYEICLITKGYVILAPAPTHEFVDTDALMNGEIRTKPKEVSEYYSAVIRIDPKLLRKTLSIGDRTLNSVFEFGAGPAFITFDAESTDYGLLCGVEKFVALLMPMSYETEFTPPGGGLALVPKAAPETEEK